MALLQAPQTNCAVVRHRATRTRQRQRHRTLPPRDRKPRHHVDPGPYPHHDLLLRQTEPLVIRHGFQCLLAADAAVLPACNLEYGDQFGRSSRRNFEKPTHSAALGAAESSMLEGVARATHEE